MSVGDGLRRDFLRQMHSFYLRIIDIMAIQREEEEA